MNRTTSGWVREPTAEMALIPASTSPEGAEEARLAIRSSIRGTSGESRSETTASPRRLRYEGYDPVKWRCERHGPLHRNPGPDGDVASSLVPLARSFRSRLLEEPIATLLSPIAGLSVPLFFHSLPYHRSIEGLGPRPRWWPRSNDHHSLPFPPHGDAQEQFASPGHAHLAGARA